MGVKNFNIIRDKYGKPVHDVTFTKIIIDASNLMHTYLSAAYSTLAKNFGKYDFGGIKLDLISQCVRVVKDAFFTVKCYLYGLLRAYPNASITCVFDPIKTPNYMIDSGDHNVTRSYLHAIFPDMDLKLDARSIVHVNMKEEEQKKRQGVDVIEEVLAKNKDASDEQKRLIKETMLLGSQHRIVVLTEPLMSLLLDEFVDAKHLRFIRAEYEADLLIKNLAYEYKDENVLVKSKDTDYYFLLSDLEWCYCSDLNKDASVYNPNALWTDFLGDEFSYDIVIRLSPLLGNDYTTHHGILNAKKMDEIRALLNIDDDFHYLAESRKNAKVKQLYDVFVANDFDKELDNDITDTSLLDEGVYILNSSYFKKYYVSVIIYMQWGFYDKYEVIDNIELHLPRIVKNTLEGGNKDNAEDTFIEILHDDY